MSEFSRFVAAAVRCDRLETESAPDRSGIVATSFLKANYIRRNDMPQIEEASLHGRPQPADICAHDLHLAQVTRDLITGAKLMHMRS